MEGESKELEMVFDYIGKVFCYIMLSFFFFCFIDIIDFFFDE